MDMHAGSIEQNAHTGFLPPWRESDDVVKEAFAFAKPFRTGAVADYIPVLAAADPELFGLSVVDTAGRAHDVGDTGELFSIQSVSKAFVYALVTDALGHNAASKRVGVNNTGLPFNSVIAIELNEGHPGNPMVNAGAIATTGLIPADSPEQRWEAIRSGLSRFAGRELQVDEAVYTSESETNHRNRAIATLLQSYGHLSADPRETVDIYTRQCALSVTAHDLAVMASTLADGGVNPVTGERVVAPFVCRDALAVLAASGLYERSGEWLFEIGLPGKSGVAGGIMAVSPGKGGIGAYSPRLDPAGNSVRGQVAVAYLSRALGLNVFASLPAT